MEADIEIRTAPGDLAPSGIAYRCPSCGREDWLPFANEVFTGWQWDGNRKAPTLIPSVLHRDCGFHAFLEEGQWRIC